MTLPHQLLVVLALNGQVAALLKSNGKTLWATKLPGASGSDFVTLTATESHVYACSDGHAHCLDLLTGQILRTNDLKGFGYGIASICVPGNNATASAPDIAAQAQLEVKRQSSPLSPAHPDWS